MISCLTYVRKNIVIDAASESFRFVPGKPFGLSLRQGVALDFLRDYIEDKTEDAINNKPFNPCFF